MYFNKHNNGIITKQFFQKNCNTFLQACYLVKSLPYKRNVFKENILCVLEENSGTCSTKHALLKRLADENSFHGIILLLGIFMMNSKNTPKIKFVLEKYKISEVPEAHNYLKVDGKILDCTRKGSSENDFIDDLVEEIEILPEKITDFKVQYHKNFIQKYLLQHPEIQYSLEEFWKIREECILALQS